MDELMVQPDALTRRAQSWEEAADWLRDSEREVEAVSLTAAGEAVRPAAARFWAAAQLRTRWGREGAEALAQGLRDVVADVGDADQLVADGLQTAVMKHGGSSWEWRRG